MDCKTARLLIEFHRPRADELGPAETTSLEEHLAACSECEATVRAEHRADEVIGRAMRQVEVPDRLRARVLSRLAADRAEHYRRRSSRVLRAAAAAALLLSAAATYAWWANRPAPVDVGSLEAFWDRIKADHFSPPDADRVRARFREMGVEVSVPRRFDYSYLTAYGLGEFRNQQVPQLVFVREGNGEARAAHAQVLILSPRQFNLDRLTGNWQSEAGYPYRVDTVRYSDSAQVYVIFHTGDNFDWLQKPDEAPAL